MGEASTCLRYPFVNGGFKLQYNFELRQAFSRTEWLKVNERRGLRIGAGDRSNPRRFRSRAWIMKTGEIMLRAGGFYTQLRHPREKNLWYLEQVFPCFSFNIFFLSCLQRTYWVFSRHKVHSWDYFSHAFPKMRILKLNSMLPCECFSCI